MRSDNSARFVRRDWPLSEILHELLGHVHTAVVGVVPVELTLTPATIV
jgi:hypothetical protein